MSDKFISELERVRVLKSSDLIPISQGINNIECKADINQLFGDDSNWQNFNLSRNYRHPDPVNFPKYRKVGKVTYLSGTLYIPNVFGDLTHNFQSVKVDTNCINVNNNILYFLSDNNRYNSILFEAAPEKSVYFRNIVLTRRYVVDQLNSNPNDDYSYPLSTVVTLQISPTGWIAVHSLSAVNIDFSDLNNNYNYWGQYHPGSHPMSQLATILPKDSKFPTYNQVNVGLSTENNAVTIPPFNDTILVPEDIDTTKATDLGGFRIDLSGLHFVNSVRKEFDYFYNRS